jgi:hypothetical protein
MQATATGRGGDGGGAALGETQERFLRDMALRLPIDLVVEVHLFPAMRQGGVETGLAVIAARREVETAEAHRGAEAAGAEPAGAVPSDESVESGGPPPQLHDATSEGAEHNPSVAERTAGAPGGPDAEAEGSAEAAGPVEREDTPGESSPGAEPGAAPTPVPPAEPLPERHTVFSARYRLTLKGPDRGKWEVDVVEEADAPLVTVDAVVRGVQRRAGEGAEPERYSAEQLRAGGVPPWRRGRPPTRSPGSGSTCGSTTCR